MARLIRGLLKVFGINSAKDEDVAKETASASTDVETVEWTSVWEEKPKKKGKKRGKKEAKQSRFSYVKHVVKKGTKGMRTAQFWIHETKPEKKVWFRTRGRMKVVAYIVARNGTGTALLLRRNRSTFWRKVGRAAA